MRQIFSLLAMLLCFASHAQNQDSIWVANNYVKWEKMVPMRDGIQLFTTIYLPKDSTEKHPILFSRTPYSCAPYGTAFNSGLWQSYRLKYLKEKYIMVQQDVRGRYMSEGEFVDVRPFNPNKKGKEFDEASDTYDAIDWLINNLPGNNQQVGVFGISYPGFYTSMAALSGHPALRAVSPQAPVTDWFEGDDFHHNGAFFQMDGFGFYSVFGKPRPKPTTDYGDGFKYPTRDNYEFYLRAGTLKNLAAMIGDSIKFWHELYQHPNLDDFWKARNVRNFTTNIKPAILVVGGLFDAEDCFGAWRLYESIEQKSPATNNKIVMGPWCHGCWARQDGSKLGYVEFGSNTSQWYQDNIEIPFFNFYLKGKGELKLNEATIFFSGANEWKTFETWPPKNATAQNAYLQAGGKIKMAQSPQMVNAFINSVTSYISDPAHPVPYTEDVHFRRTREYMLDDQRFANRRSDVASFQTEVLTEDMTVSGAPVADLFVSTSGTDADFVVKIIDVFPDDFRNEGKYEYPMGGYQMLVRGEVMRGKYRNSFEKPEPFVPGQPTKVRFRLPDIAHTFKKGHRLMIQIQSSWFPLVDRNPQKFVNIYQADEKDFMKAEIKIYHDAAHASAIELPVLAK
jgi:uncharacterized protein